MTLGLAQRQRDLLDDNARFCEEAVGPNSIYSLLHRERDQLFPDEMFADLFATRGRRSVPPSVVATVMVLQKLDGASDREAVERFTFDKRWKYAAGVAEDAPGCVHTVLVDMRARLRDSADPNRIFRVTREVAGAAGLLGVKRVLDSAPLFDAVATQDTVSLIRGAIRGVLRACPAERAAEIRRYLRRDDDYERAGKPACDWDDPEAREELVDALVRDGLEVLKELEGRSLEEELTRAATLLATVVGQDIEQTPDGTFRIARRTAPDRVISTVDPEARHGHKSQARGFDGYKGHLSIEPDSEIITAAEVGPANGGDGALLPELLDEFAQPAEPQETDADASTGEVPDDGDQGPPEAPVEGGVVEDSSVAAAPDAEASPTPVVYGDSAYGSGASLAFLEGIRAKAMVKVQPTSAPGGRFPKDRFAIDLTAGTVTCPRGAITRIRPRKDGGGEAHFGSACERCPLRRACTTSREGRVITITPHEALLARSRAAQANPAWREDYRANRPTVERKLAHMLRRRHGGRRARVRGRPRVAHDWKLSPPRSTSPAWRPWASVRPAKAGRWQRPEREHRVGRTIRRSHRARLAPSH